VYKLYYKETYYNTFIYLSKSEKARSQDHFQTTKKHQSFV
jgi:hypothetical protein